MHDSDVWRSSRAKEYLQAVYPTNHEWLLGDSGYPLEPWLLTPLKETENDDQILYNESLAKARSTVVRTIGLLKGRWRCLCKESMLLYKPDTCSEIINACATLHNICVDSYDELPEDELVPDEEDDTVIVEGPDEALQNEAMQNCCEVIEYMRQHQ